MLRTPTPLVASLLFSALLLTLTAPLLVPRAALAAEVDLAAEEAFFVGVALLEAGDAASAIGKFDQALRIDPTLRRVHFYRARAWALLGDIAEANADADTYASFPLAEAEASQLAELRAEIAARAEQIGTATGPDRPAPRPVQPEEVDTGPDGIGLLRDAEAALARGDCQVAVDGAQAALVADNTLTRAFLIKGLGLECLGDGARALTVIGMYEELRAGMPADPVASAARTRIEAGVTGAAPGLGGPSWQVLGQDPRIEGVLGQRFGTPMTQALEVRTRRTWLPGVGEAEVGRPRMGLGGSTSRVERAWAGQGDQLAWTRLRVFERSGIETTGWFARSFGELYREVERSAGPPDEVFGLEGTPEDPDGAKWALKGPRRIEVRWTDADGDQVRLRLGRCTLPDELSKVHPENAPCLELVAWSGSWKRTGVDADPTYVAHRRIEAPGRLQVDFSGGFGFGVGPQLWQIDWKGSASQAAFGGEVGLDTQLRVAFGAGVVGLGYALSVFGRTDGLNLNDGPFLDHRVTAYFGLRDRPRQRSFVDLTAGFGLVPETTGTAPVVSLRIQATARTAPIGRFYLSFEPYVVLGTDLTFVPIRLSIGGLFGTKQRPVRN